MKFAIGDEFRTLTGKWRVTDVGSRVVVAIRIDRVNTNHGTLSGDEAETQGWFNGPPYAVMEHIFDEDGLEEIID